MAYNEYDYGKNRYLVHCTHAAKDIEAIIEIKDAWGLVLFINAPHTTHMSTRIYTWDVIVFWIRLFSLYFKMQKSNAKKSVDTEIAVFSKFY